MRRNDWLVAVVAVVALVVGIAIGRHSSSKGAASTPTTTAGTAPTPVLRVETPTTAKTTATCGGVTFPWTTGVVCATFGKPVSVSGVQVTASNVRAINDPSAGHNICLDASLVNKSGQSVSYSLDNWGLDSVSPQGSFHLIENTAQLYGSNELGEGQLVPNGSASGSVCFSASPSEYAGGHLLVTYLAPGNAIKSAVWVEATAADTLAT